MSNYSTDKRDNLPFGRGMALAAWLSAMMLLYLGFSYWEEDRLYPNRSPASSLTDDGRVEVLLYRNAHNHYITAGKINGESVTFLLDTGATNVVIPMELANRLGLVRGTPRIAATANGMITLYSTLIDRLSIGRLELTNVSASLNPNMTNQDILLGMSVLGKVELLQQGNQLRIRGMSSR